MRKDYTHFTFVLDKSGSMESSIVETIQGLNAFIEKNKIGKKATYSLYVFNDIVKEECSFIDIDLYNSPVIRTSGMTSLFDAFVTSVDKTGQTIARMKEDDRPEKVIVVVLTDGGENSSKESSNTDVKSRLDEQKNKYNWDFVFLGADFNIDKYASDFGLEKRLSRNVSKCNISEDLESVGTVLSSYRSAGYDDKKLNSFITIGN